jgi:hypothetical protein
VAVGDLDGDSDLDLAVAGVSLLLNDGSGTFAAAVSYGAAGNSVAICDLDGDSDLDLAVANGGSNHVSVLLNKCTCRGDVARDRVVGIIDFLSVLAAWGSCPGCPEDIDGDGAVGLPDFMAVRDAWGPCG